MCIRDRDQIINHKNTKHFYSGQNKRKAKGILAQSRGVLGLLIKAITGHNFLGYHQNKVDSNISKVCRLCEEEYETFWHLIDECPRLRLTRQDIFLDRDISPDMSWSIKKLVQFINIPIIQKMLTSKAGLSEIEEREIAQLSDEDF